MSDEAYDEAVPASTGRIEAVLEYLKSPIAVGVYTIAMVLDFKGIEDYLEGLLAPREGPLGGEARSSLIERRSRLKDQLEEFKNTPSFLPEEREVYFSKLSSVLGNFALHCDCPQEMKMFVSEHRVKIGDRERVIRRPSREAVFSSRVLSEIGDVVDIARRRMGGRKWFFDVTSIGEGGVSGFKTVVNSIPPIREHMKVLREGKRHSSRYSFRPYPLATSLWLRHEVSAVAPPDLKSFLQGAVDYISENEWRTSIILSAIAVESELADMYEESYKSPAPDVPLGDLFQKVRAKVSFPDEIALAVETANRARIAAVHRSRLPVSQREAVNALYGAVNFTHWHVCA